MWKQVIIQKSYSPWISPLNLVMKKKSDDALIVERWMILGYVIKMVLNQILKIFARFWNGQKMLLKYVKCYEWLRVWPLIHITKKDVPFQMDWKLQYSFCKNWRISYRTRYYGLSDVKWRIYSKKKTDASCYNAGAVLVKYKMAKKELFYVPVWPWRRPRIVIIASLTENYQQ